MERIIIWGTGSLARKFISYLDHEKIEIVSIIDNDINKKGIKFNNITISDCSILKKIEFDNLVIASSYYQEILNQIDKVFKDKERVVTLKYFENYLMELDLTTRIDTLINKPIQEVHLGLSYIRDGFYYEDFNLNKVVNLGFSSQDIYSDFCIIHHLLEVLKISSIKKVVMGHGLFSFNYELSKTRNGKKVEPRYFQLKGKLDSFSQGELTDYLRARLKFSEWLKPSLLDPYPPKYYILDDLTLEEKRNGKDTAERHNSKYYPKTVAFNLAIFDEVCELLTKYNIEIVICIFPVTEYYRNYINKNMINSYYKILNKFQKKYNIKLIDYFSESELFSELDFWDATHLNRSGAKKMSEIYRYL